MTSEERRDSIGDWRRILDQEEITGQDLYNLLDDVLTDHVNRNPLVSPKGSEAVNYSDTINNLVSMNWREGRINMQRFEPSEEKPYSLIDVEVSLVGKGEVFQLRRDFEGGVKAFWLRNKAFSEILGEELEEWQEVSLTPSRTKRIARAIVISHANTIAGLSGSQ